MTKRPRKRVGKPVDTSLLDYIRYYAAIEAHYAPLIAAEEAEREARWPTGTHSQPDRGEAE